MAAVHGKNEYYSKRARFQSLPFCQFRPTLLLCVEQTSELLIHPWNHLPLRWDDDLKTLFELEQIQVAFYQPQAQVAAAYWPAELQTSYNKKKKKADQEAVREIAANFNTQRLEEAGLLTE